MTACPSPEKWQDYVHDRLDPEQERALTEHVEACKACEELLAALITPLHQTAAQQGCETPPHLIERLCRMWPSFPAVDSTQEQFWPTIAGYRILGVLGQGGMGVVYRAWQESLGRTVALKMIAAGSLGAAGAARLLNDARTAARLHHSGVVPIYAVGEHHGMPYCVMELVEGGTLAQRVSDLVAAPRQAARLIAEAARALHYAHNEGICHRDVKPANILLRIRPDPSGWCASLTPGNGPLPRLENVHACVTDFGLARPIDSSGLTPENNILGTPGYIAPEQVRLDRPSPAADVFSLGAALYECLTGRRPFQGATPVDTLLLTLQNEPDRPRLLNAQLPRDLETVCLKCLEKEPRRRYSTAQDLAADLERFLDGKPVAARPVGWLEQGWRWCRRKPLVASLITALLLAMATGFSASFVLWRQADGEAARAQISEREALASLHKEEAARQDLEKQNDAFCNLLRYSVSPTKIVIGGSVSPESHEFVLMNIERLLTALIERRDKDLKLRVFRASVLTQLGGACVWNNREAEGLSFLERAAKEWQCLQTEGRCTPEDRAYIAITYGLLWRVYQRRQPDRAQASLASALHSWQELLREPPDNQNHLAITKAHLGIGYVLAVNGYSQRRPDKLHDPIARPATGAECEPFFDLTRVAYLVADAEKHGWNGEPATAVPAVCEAAAILRSLLLRPSLQGNTRCQLAHFALEVSVFLRRAGETQQALGVCLEASHAMQALVEKAPAACHFLEASSRCWIEAGKARWDLRQPDESLAAFRNALAAQRQAFLMAPEAFGSRHQLDMCYRHLGRRLCELGRLDEAEASFKERLALWPADAGRQTKLLAELRQWAAQAAEHAGSLSPPQRLEWQRYLDLAARLQPNGKAKQSTVGGD